MALLAAVGLLLALAAAALRWGRDSRDPTRGIAGAGGLLPGGWGPCDGGWPRNPAAHGPVGGAGGDRGGHAAGMRLWLARAVYDRRGRNRGGNRAMRHAGVRSGGETGVRRAEGAGEDDARREASALIRTATGRVLREAREARGWSHLGTARRAGVPLRSVTRLELGQQPSPALRDVRPIVAALGFDVGPFINAVEYRAVVIHADEQDRIGVSTGRGAGSDGSSPPRRALQTRRALRSLADELRARARDRGRAGDPWVPPG